MELPFKTGMIYRSKTHPQFDLIIDFVTYQFDDDNKIENYGTVICWCNINEEEFDKFTNIHCKSKDTTYPYAYCGECSIKSMKARLKKYNLEFQGFSDDEVIIYQSPEWEYLSGFKDKFSKLS